MQRLAGAITFAILTFTVIASAQNPPAAPKPGPELKKLEYFVGNWSEEGDMKPSAFGPGGKFSGTEKIEWMEGGFFLIGHSEGSSSMGSEKGISFWGYDTENKVYTFHEFNSSGESITSTGTVDSDSWTWTSADKMGGKMIKSRYIIKQTSPSSYTFKLDLQPEGGEWSQVFEGKATKK